MKKRKFKKKVITGIVIFLILFIAVVLYFHFSSSKPDGKDDSENPIDNRNNDSNNAGNNDDSNNFPKTQTTYLNNIKYTVSIDKEVESAVVSYMDLYYKSLQNLTEYDMKDLFYSAEQAYINQTAVSMLIEYRSLQSNDLRLSSAAYDLDIKSATTSGSDIKVTVRETSYLNFNFMKDIQSKIYNITNEFTFRKIDGEYKIVKYSKIQDFFVMIEEYYTSSDDYKTRLDNLKNNYITGLKNRIELSNAQHNDYLNNTGINRKTCDNSYNRESALEYAKKWVPSRNTEWPEWDANCQNYASQMLYAGGIPMDNVGNVDSYLQWSSYKAIGSSGYGLIYTWTSVPRFYQYIKNNNGYGLCGDIDVNLYYAEPGDVISMGITAANRHVVVVIGNVTKNDKVVDILVNSNTIDLENYPMSAYIYPFTSLLKVYGWNN